MGFELMLITDRIWDVNDRSKQKQVIVVKSKERGARTMVSTCAWSHDGKLIAGGESPSPITSSDIVAPFCICQIRLRDMSCR